MYRARARHRSRRHRLRGVDYHVTEWGEPGYPLLVFLHGWGDAGSTFQFVVDELKGDWFVIAPDWRGFGESGNEAQSYWFPDYLADLDAILGIYSPDAPVRLVGHSMGANVASLYAGVMPERVEALINVEGFGLPETKPEDAPAHYRKWLETGRERPVHTEYASIQDLVPRIRRLSPKLDEDRALFVADKWAEAGADGVVRIKMDRAHKLPNAVLYRRKEAAACWAAVTAPVLIVIGADTDHRFLLERWRESEDRPFRRQASLTIEGAGHMIHFDQPGALAEAIETFLVNSSSTV